MRFHREEYVALMTFGRAERPMFVELFGLMVGVDRAWAAQGAAPDEIDLSAFDWDYVPVVPCGGNAHVRGGFEERVVSETADFEILKDNLGRTLKRYKSVSSIPLPLDYPVKDWDSWRAIKPLFAFGGDRIDAEAAARAAAARREGALVLIEMPGGFDLPRQLMGAERACLAYYDQPDLMRDMLATAGETACRVIERVAALVTIDQLSVHEDLAGRNGPLVGPAQFREFIAPYYRRVWERAAAAGARLFDMDTDGNVEALIDLFLDAGLTGLAPVEPAAGMDMVALRRKYGRRLALKGGIDKFVLRKGKEAIRAELEYKLQPLMRAGGTVFGLDHRVPDGTPLEDYRFYVDLGREILGLPPRSSAHRGWRRMAF